MEAQITKPDFYIGNEVLEKVVETKFLGVYVDDNLDWNEHINCTKKKMSGEMYALDSSSRKRSYK